MRYSTESRFRKYVKGYGFLSFARKFSEKYGKKLMDIATRTGIDAAKTASKRVAHKTAEATGDLIGYKIADKITSVGKSEEKEKTEKIYIPLFKGFSQRFYPDFHLYHTILLKLRNEISKHS